MTVSMIDTSPRCDGLDQIAVLYAGAGLPHRPPSAFHVCGAIVLSSTMRDVSNEDNRVKYEHDVCANLVQNITLRSLQ
jgi:hypothetical protein